MHCKEGRPYHKRIHILDWAHRGIAALRRSDAPCQDRSHAASKARSNMRVENRNTGSTACSCRFSQSRGDLSVHLASCRCLTTKNTKLVVLPPVYVQAVAGIAGIPTNTEKECLRTQPSYEWLELEPARSTWLFVRLILQVACCVVASSSGYSIVQDGPISDFRTLGFLASS